jgi:hypothetical protein
MRFLLRPGVLLATAVVSLLLAITAVGLITWMAVDPERWFPDAFAQQGVQGPPGPRGPEGPAGPAGPVGPDAASEIDDLSFRVSDVEDSVETVDGRLDDLETGSGDEASMSVDDIATTVQAMCDEFYNSIEPLYDVYFAAC